MLDGYARVSRGFAIVANGVDRSAAVGQMKEECETEEKRGKNYNAPRDWRVADRAETNLLGTSPENY